MLFRSEEQVARLAGIVQQYESEQGRKIPDSERAMLQSHFYQELERISNKGELLTPEDWQKIEHEVKHALPAFWELLANNRQQLTPHEYEVCVLVRLKFQPKSIGNMIGLSPSSISKIRINLLYKLFGIEGKSADFDKRIVNI